VGKCEERDHSQILSVDGSITLELSQVTNGGELVVELMIGTGSGLL
jgi:hypothetical protein